MSESLARTFEELITLNFQLYNGLFLTLPLDAVEQTGLLLPLLEADCQRGLQQGKDPQQILQEFFHTHKAHFSESEQVAFLFKVIQYVERQVVLVDALEDAAYERLHQIDKFNVLRLITERAQSDNLQQKFSEILKKFGIRVTLTAHPTQFYPGPVLAIINDLSRAISRNDTSTIRELLQQLGNTPFFRKEKPSPYDEAVLLTWYLGNIFYPVMGKIVDRLAEQFPKEVDANHSLMAVGFWPGGDRDGNPFVTVETTRRVAAKLRYSIASCYHRDLRELKRRLTFNDLYVALDRLEKLLHLELSEHNPVYRLDAASLVAELDTMETLLLQRHQGLYIDLLRSFRRKVNLFGFHFASLDIRQDSSVIRRTLAAVVAASPGLLPADFDQLEEEQQIDCLLAVEGSVDIDMFADPVLQDTLKSFAAIREIQLVNGQRGCHRYIISNCHGAVDVARAHALFRLCGWAGLELSMDIVPLFESIEDLRRAGTYMAHLYRNPRYRQHLHKRHNRQTIMLGFSDGTKDGGYLMANWGIYRAKEDLTEVSRAVDIEAVFFDGRGGPPARGGGSTYLFYAALGKRIESNQIQMTVQGQTVSTHYGIRQAAEHNLNQLLAAGLENNLYDRPERELDEGQRRLIQSLAEKSHEKYQAFKQHPLFIPYLEEMSTLNYYNMANIGSRPARRGGGSSLRFEDLRAIPFVGAWAQLKQNVPGYYGLGTALKALADLGQRQACMDLYRRSGFFRALVSNSMQAMAKSNFAITRYMESDPRFGSFWSLIHDEFELTRDMVLEVSGQTELLQDNPRSRLSIALRERIVLPLLVIQQYALMRIHQLRASEDPRSDEQLETYEKMVVRSLYGNINASRNSA